MKDKELRKRVSDNRWEFRICFNRLSQRVEELADKLGYEFYNQIELKDLIRKKK